MAQTKTNLRKINAAKGRLAVPAKAKRPVQNVDVELPGALRKRVLSNARRVADDGRKAQWILLALQDVKG